VRQTRIAVAAVLLSLFSAPALTQASTPTFSFAAAGDHAQTDATAATLSTLATAGTDFYLALGDLSYAPGTVGQESGWCDFVKSRLGNTYPFELLGGNHEEDGSGQGRILNFAKCLPDKLSATGLYGVEYYFDYLGLARIILISPALKVGGVSYNYLAADPHYTWLANTIDAARAAGIPWVIVGTHKMCLSVGGEPCEISSDLMALLLQKRVDLVLHAHDHVYERSKQLTCASADVFVPECVVDDGSDNAYAKQAGTVFVVDGTFGRAQDGINLSDPQAAYFVDNFAGNNMNLTYGFTRYTVTPTRLSAQFVRSSGGTFSDEFEISAPDDPVSFDFSLSKPANIAVTQGSSIAFTVNGTLLSAVTQPIAFQVSGLPQDASAAMEPASCDPACQSVVTISAAITTPVGTYPIIIRGEGGGVIRTTTLSLAVAAAADRTAPVIAAIGVTTIQTKSAVIVWTTDEVSDSRVRYGTSAGSLSKTVSSSTLVGSHAIKLSSLSANKTYYFSVSSKDASGNAAVSTVRSFKTLR
jgi:hypothetical protein